MKYIAPERLLLIGSVLSIISTALVIITSGRTLTIALILISIFMSLMFPTIYGIALEGVENPAYGGQHGDAKLGASGLIMAILGGAILTPLMGFLSDNTSINFAYIVPLICFIIVMIYAAIESHRKQTLQPTALQS